jgi:hypothetical protein
MIEQVLEPGYSYVVFEKTTAWGQSDEFYEVLRILGDIGIVFQVMRLIQGSTGSNSLMLVRLEPCPADKIMQRLLSAGLPEGVSLYAYGDLPAEQATHNGLNR